MMTAKWWLKVVVVVLRVARAEWEPISTRKRVARAEREPISARETQGAALAVPRQVRYVASRRNYHDTRFCV